MIKSVLLTLFRQFAGIIFGLGTSILLARGLGSDQFGVYAIALLFGNILSTVLNLGIPAGNVFFVASKKVGFAQSFKTTTHFLIAISLVSWLLLTPLLYFFHDSVFPNIPLLYLNLVLLCFPFVLAHQLYLSFFQALEDFKSHNLYSLLPQALLFTFVVFQSFFGFSILDTLIVFLSTHLLTLLLFLPKLLPYVQKEAQELLTDYPKQLFKYSGLSHFSNILTFINYRADLFLINFFMNPVSVGIYAITIRLVEKLWIFSQSSSAVILPRLSSYKEENNASSLSFFVGKLVLYVTLFFSLLFLLIGEWLIEFLFSDKYAESFITVPYLIPGILIGSISRIFSNSLAAMNKPHLNFYTSLITLVINISLNLLLIPRYGLIGAATATSTAYVCSSFIKISLYCSITKSSIFSAFIPNAQDAVLLRSLFKRGKKA